MKKKRKRLITYPKLKKKLWDTFSIYIRRRDQGKCYTCGKVGNWKYDMDAGHYVPKNRGGLLLYFDERAVNSQCTYCNRFLHGNLDSYAIALRKQYGDSILEELAELKRKGHGLKLPRSWFVERIEYYQNKINELDNG